MKHLYYEKKVKKIKNKPYKKININYFYNKNKLLLNLFKSDNHYGFPITKSNYDSFSYLYGIRGKQAIIDLNILIQKLKHCFRIIALSLKQNKKILFVVNDRKNKEINTFFKENISSKNITVITKKWKTGLLTHNLLNYELIVILSIKGNDILLKEANIIGIPVISLVDTDTCYNNINYPIVTNTTNIKSFFFIMYLFKCFIKRNN